MDKFSNNKALWYVDRISDLRKGRDIVPVHVQIVLSDLCNQNCHFCLTEDAIIDTISGSKPIKEIRVGDFVFGPDGLLASVTAISERISEEIYEISCGQKTIRATGEHPFLTKNGWKKANSLRSGDSTVVRVRMRDSCPSVQGDLEYISTQPSKKRGNVCCCTTKNIGENEEKQSDEKQGCCCESFTEKKRSKYKQIIGRNKEYCGSSKEKNVIGFKSDEGLCAAQRSNEENTESFSQQERAAFYGLVKEERTSNKTYRRRFFLDREKESRLQDNRTTESIGNNTEGMLYEYADGAYSSGLRVQHDCSLQKQGVGVFGDLQERSQMLHSRETTESNTTLCIEGIELERGLELRPIDSIRKIPGRFVVYNFSCKPQEAYEANGFVVHNCAYRMEGGFSTEQFGGKNPKRFIPTEKAKEILSDCSELGVEAIEFTGGGEPTVHPDWAEIIEFAQLKGLQTGLVTNGVLLKDCRAVQDLIWLRVSLDCAMMKTYEEVRGVNSWGKAMKALEYGARFKDRPYVGVGFVVTQKNYSEIAMAARLVKAMGIPYMRISAMFSHNGSDYYKDIKQAVLEEIIEAKFEQCSSFHIVDFFSDRLADLDSGRPDYGFCGYQQFCLYIGGDQKVYTCCTNAYTKKGEIGDLSQQSFKTWLYRTRRYDFNPMSCHHCQFNDKNKAIGWMLKKPEHVSFI